MWLGFIHSFVTAISKAQNINSSSVSEEKKDPGKREAREKKKYPWCTYTEWILLLNDFELFYAC